MLTPEQAKQLREAGLTAYNHNLDTSPEYYSKITSSRKYEASCLLVPLIQVLIASVPPQQCRKSLPEKPGSVHSGSPVAVCIEDGPERSQSQDCSRQCLRELTPCRTGWRPWTV